MVKSYSMEAPARERGETPGAGGQRSEDRAAGGAPPGSLRRGTLPGRGLPGLRVLSPAGGRGGALRGAAGVLGRCERDRLEGQRADLHPARGALAAAGGNGHAGGGAARVGDSLPGLFRPGAPRRLGAPALADAGRRGAVPAPAAGPLEGARRSTWTRTRCPTWRWRWTTARTCEGASWVSTRRAAFRRSGCWCRGSRRGARRGSRSTCAGGRATARRGRAGPFPDGVRETSTARSPRSPCRRGRDGRSSGWPGRWARARGTRPEDDPFTRTISMEAEARGRREGTRSGPCGRTRGRGARGARCEGASGRPRASRGSASCSRSCRSRPSMAAATLCKRRGGLPAAPARGVSRGRPGSLIPSFGIRDAREHVEGSPFIDEVECPHENRQPDRGFSWSCDFVSNRLP